MRRAIWLGLSLGVAMLGRDELVLLVLFLLVPLVLLAKALSWRRRFAVLGVGLLAAAAVVAPWVGYNMSRFQDPVFISNGLGVTLDSANCDAVYSGAYEGYWSLLCARTAANRAINPHVDESVQAAEAQAYAVRYIKHHEDRLFPVEMARLGRAFGFFHPLEQIKLDSTVETRPYHWALVGLGMYYALVALSIAGVVILRRRRVPVFPLLALGLDVVVSVLLAFGNTRYRSTFEVALALLAAVTIDAVWSQVSVRSSVRSSRSLRRSRHLFGQRPGVILESADLPTEPDADGEEEQHGDHRQQVGRVLDADMVGDRVEQAGKDGENGDDHRDRQPGHHVLLVELPPSGEFDDDAERDECARQGDDVDSGHNASVVGGLVEEERRRNTERARKATTRTR